MISRKTVFVGLSGGVDSSVAALRLIKAGYRVVGVFIKVWHPEWLVCNWQQERLDAMRVAAKLGIPFLTCNAELEYEQEVAKHFISEYKKGRTPNPDVMCNQQVKFGAFLKFALAQGADYIATGHYAQVLKTTAGIELHRGTDAQKDQSYFLWTLTEEQLKHVLFPIGLSRKSTVRKEAAISGLPTASKPDSQGICFLGQIDIREFLSHYIDLNPGAVLDENAIEIGHHQGALLYTQGQRHGFTINSKETARQPHYVVSRNLEANTVTVSTEPLRLTAGTAFQLEELNPLRPLRPGQIVEFQTRYRQTPALGRISNVRARKAVITVDTPQDLPVSGQSCVLYEGSLMLGGGIIA